MNATEAAAEAILAAKGFRYPTPAERRIAEADARAAVDALAAQGVGDWEPAINEALGIEEHGPTGDDVRSVVTDLLARQAAVHATREAAAADLANAMILESDARAEQAERALRHAEQVGIGEWTVTADAYSTATAAIEKHRARAELAEGKVVSMRAEHYGIVKDNAALRTTVERVRAIHKPFGIWDECDCPDERKDDSDHVEIDEVGRTCRRLYDVCAECCVDNDYHTEACADSHDHGPDKPICATIAALADPKGESA